MKDLMCPHCHGAVPHGAKVCRGCHAEIEYGTPFLLYVALLIASLYLGYKSSNTLPDSFSFLAWAIGIGTFVAGGILFEKIFKNRISFKREYKTK